MTLTPEQFEAERPEFESRIRPFWVEPMRLRADGAGYENTELAHLWEGWQQALLHMAERATPMGGNTADELRRMRQYSKCFTGAFDAKEPVFVLRAQDASAYKAVAQWVVSNREVLGESHPKIISAKATMQLMREWPRARQAD